MVLLCFRKELHRESLRPGKGKWVGLDGVWGRGAGEVEVSVRVCVCEGVGSAH